MAENQKDRMLLLRGEVIQDMITVESIMDKIIVLHFTKDDDSIRGHFHQWIISRMSFQNKKQTLIKIIQNIDGSIDHKDLSRTLEKLYDFRNNVAHWQWGHISDESITIHKNPFERKIITERELAKFKERKTKVQRILGKILFKHFDPLKEG